MSLPLKASLIGSKKPPEYERHIYGSNQAIFPSRVKNCEIAKYMNQ